MGIETKQRVLLIEDDAVDRESVHRAIGSQFIISDADQAALGLERALIDRPDCVLLDFRLPDMDGIQLLPTLKEEGFPVVMMTGVGNESVAVEAMKCGAQDYISKVDVSSELLRKTILTAIKNVDLHRQLKEQRQELESFVSIASHDLRAPLRHIVRFSEILRDECRGKIGDELYGYLERIVVGGSQMTDLLNALVEFARSGRNVGDLDAVNLNEAVEQASANLSDLIEVTEASLKVKSLPVVLGHQVSLIELFQNLIGNALKYASDSEPIIDIDASRDGSTWKIAVRDNGIGIASEYHEQIFMPFRRLHSYSDIEGSGIGLATCKKIVEHHRGEIWVESELKMGTTFFFTLQAADAIAQRSEANPAVACPAT